MNTQLKKTYFLWIIFIFFWIGSSIGYIQNSFWWFKEEETPIGILLWLPLVALIIFSILSLVKIISNINIVIIVVNSSLGVGVIPILPMLAYVYIGGSADLIEFIGLLIGLSCGIISTITSLLLVTRRRKINEKVKNFTSEI